MSVLVLALAASAAAQTVKADDLEEGFDYTRGVLSVAISEGIRVPLDKEELLAWLREVHSKVAVACAQPLSLGLRLQPTQAAGKTLLQQADRMKAGVVVAVSLDRFVLDDRYSGTRHREQYGTVRWQFNHAVLLRVKRKWVPLVQGPLPGQTEANIYSGRLYSFEVRGNPIAASVSRALLPCRPASGLPPKAWVRNNRPVPVVVYALSRDLPDGSSSLRPVPLGTGSTAEPVTIKPFEEAEVRAPAPGKVVVSLAGLEGEKPAAPGAAPAATAPAPGGG
jgi:hypothetical protein